MCGGGFGSLIELLCPASFFFDDDRHIRTFAFRMKAAGPSSRQEAFEIAPIC
jgi:hypothetical protein